jgi:hypothetical protein
MPVQLFPWITTNLLKINEIEDFYVVVCGKGNL